MSDSVGKVIAETLAEARKRASGHRNAYREYMMDGGTGNHSGGALANAYVWMCNQLLVLESLARQHREEVEAAEAALGEVARLVQAPMRCVAGSAGQDARPGTQGRLRHSGERLDRSVHPHQQGDEQWLTITRLSGIRRRL